MCNSSYITSDNRKIKLDKKDTAILLINIFLSICCLIFWTLIFLVFFILIIYTKVEYKKHHIYHAVGTINEVGSNKYKASVQCLAAVLQNITTYCGSYNTIIACAEFPNHKDYTEIQFNCTNNIFIKYLENHSGGRETIYKHKNYYTLRNIFVGLMSLSSFIGLSFLFCFGLIAYFYFVFITDDLVFC